MAHGQARCSEGLKNSYTGVDGWPCQRVSLYKDSKMALGSVKILSWESHLWDGGTANWGISEAPVASLLERQDIASVPGREH